MTEESTSYECQSVAFGVQCHSLSESCRVILNCDVLKSDVRTLYLQSVCTESAHTLRSFCRADICMVVVGDDGVFGILATQFDIGEPRRYNQFLLIYTFFNIYNLVVVHKGTAHLNGIVDIAEFRRTVASHE